METLDARLSQVVAKAIAAPPGSVARQQALQELYRLVMQSNRLWREYTPYYADALQEMWEYCCQHLEEYDPTLSNVTTWLDHHLKRRLRRFRDQQSREQKRRVFAAQTEQGEKDPIDLIPSRSTLDAAVELWQKIVAWVQHDPEGTLQSTCFRKRPEINAQTLFLMRFPAETPWQTIATHFNLTPAEAQDLPKFYHRRCLPLLRNFGVSNGYLEEKQKRTGRKS